MNTQTVIKNHNLLFIVIATNIYFMLKDIQLWQNMLSPYTKYISSVVFIIFFTATITKLKYVKIFFIQFSQNKVIKLYILYFLFVLFCGPDFSQRKNVFDFIVFIIYHYITIVTIAIFNISRKGLEQNLRLLFKILTKYILIISILTIIIFLCILSGIIDLNHWIINYNIYFGSPAPTKNVDYYWPYYISIFRSDNVHHFFGLNFYRVFSISSEPGIAAIFALFALLFSLKNKIEFIIIFLYFLVIASFGAYITFLFIVMLLIFKNYPRMIYLFVFIFIGSMILIIYIFAQPDPYSIIPRIEYIHNHVYPVRTDIIKYLANTNIGIFGKGYSPTPGLLPLSLIRKDGLLGFLIFMIFLIYLFFMALHNFLFYPKKSFISVYSLIIISIIIVFFKQAFIYYYYYIFIVLSYLYYINVFNANHNNEGVKNI